MRNLLVAVALVMPLIARAADHEIVVLTPQLAEAALQEKNVYIFDNDDVDTFKAGHVPHAKLLNPFRYDAKELPSDKNATLIFYCYNEH
jgi:rhodanese-related sulfurtransferase